MLPYWRLSAYYFFYFAFIGAFSPYFSLYLASLSFSAWDIGVLMSLMQVMRLAAPNLWGYLADRMGAKTPIVRIAALLSIAGFGGIFFAHSFGGLFAAITLLAFFWSAALPLVETLTFGHLGASMNRYGNIRLWGSIGFIGAVLGVGYVLDRLPIDSLLWLSMILLGGIFLSSLLLPEAALPPSRAEQPALLDVVRQPQVLRLLTACFFMSAAHGALYVFYSIYLVDHGYSKSLVGWMWTIGVLAEIGAFLTMPKLLAIFSLRAILAFSFACAVLRFQMIAWGVDQPWILVTAQVLHGATFGAYHAAAVAAINHWFRDRHQVRGQALYGSASFGAGGMAGGLASGLLWDTAGAALTFTLSSLFALIGLVLVLRGAPDAPDAPTPSAVR